MLSRVYDVLLVGAGGYGNIYLEELLRGVEERLIRVVGVVDPAPSGCRYREQLAALQVPIFPDLDAAFQSCRADLVVVASPIQFHARHAEQALATGTSVLCEKPVAPTLQQARAMREAEQKASGFVAVGFQWSFAPQVLALKRDVLAGRLGRPRQLKTLTCWPRPESYFTRSRWAGRIALDGDWVLDSPANNAMAHYLHNQLYVAGDTLQASARPVEVQAELYRANAIENYDTVALRVQTGSGAELLFYATHAVAATRGPVLEYEFDEAIVRLDAEAGNRLVATFRDGRVHNYGEIDEYPRREYFRKLWDSLAALDGGEPVPCTIESATPQVLVVNAAQRRAEEIPTFPADSVERVATDAGSIRVVRGLDTALESCYKNGELPGECGRYAWAHAPARIVTRACDAFVF